MATHDWVFPWLALTAGLAAALIAWGGADRQVPPAPPSRSLWLLWACLAVGAIAAGLKLGAAGGFDFLAARGLMLGLLGGLPMALLVGRLPVVSRPPALLGLGTALVAAGRLWLTHAEISGLAALSLGAALTALCLGVVPATIQGRDSEADEAAASGSALGLLYLLSLAAAVALGFLRAHTLGDMFWADIPLLLGAGLSVGAALGAGWVRRRPTLLAQALPPVIGAGLVLLLLASVTHIGRLAGLLALGALLFAVLSRLSARSSSEDGRSGRWSGWS